MLKSEIQNQNPTMREKIQDTVLPKDHPALFTKGSHTPKSQAQQNPQPYSCEESISNHYDDIQISCCAYSHFNDHGCYDAHVGNSNRYG
mmetsp:Transcript_20371/g.30008  ORF Transcript_20371/g.30008 Transcript_20371/m.30008 type:complete len:89 (-) Transcript_20371:1994-2260(-)